MQMAPGQLLSPLSTATPTIDSVMEVQRAQIATELPLLHLHRRRLLHLAETITIYRHRRPPSIAEIKFISRPPFVQYTAIYISIFINLCQLLNLNLLISTINFLKLKLLRHLSRLYI